MSDPGYAFPFTSDAINLGMTLRDYFAGQALAGFVGNEAVLIALRDEAESRGMKAKEAVAAACYETADSMIAERDK